MKKRVLILTVAVLILLAAIPFAAAAENKLGKKIEGFEVTAKELKNGVVTLREDSEAGDPYVLFIDSDKDWKATLENTKLVKFSDQMLVGSMRVPAEVKNEKEASGEANTPSYLTLEIAAVPAPGQTLTQKLTFTVGEETSEYEIRMTAPAPKFELKCTGLSGSKIVFDKSAEKGEELVVLIESDLAWSAELEDASFVRFSVPTGFVGGLFASIESDTRASGSEQSAMVYAIKLDTPAAKGTTSSVKMSIRVGNEIKIYTISQTKPDDPATPTPTVKPTEAPDPVLKVKNDHISGKTMTLDEDASAGDSYTLIISADTDWKAELADSKFVVLEKGVDDKYKSATVKDTRNASGAAGKTLALSVTLLDPPEAGESKSTKLTFHIGSKTVTYKIRMNEPEATPEPTEEPTPEPTATPEPTPEPTAEPTAEPTEEPTAKPTDTPEPVLTAEPTEAPVQPGPSAQTFPLWAVIIGGAIVLAGCIIGMVLLVVRRRK